jgi:hypothetical protein
MRLGLKGLLGGVVGALMLAGVGCGSGDSADPGTIGSDDPQTQADEALRRHRPAPKPAPPPSTDPGPGGTSGSGSSGTGSSGGGMTTEQVIAAAQTPDGRAIPQPSGPNHTCPDVVVRIGFWSCPTIGDTCSSGGRSCTCNRTDGEGQNPSWSCD